MLLEGGTDGLHTIGREAGINVLPPVQQLAGAAVATAILCISRPAFHCCTKTRMHAMWSNVGLERCVSYVSSP